MIGTSLLSEVVQSQWLLSLIYILDHFVKIFVGKNWKNWPENFIFHELAVKAVFGLEMNGRELQVQVFVCVCVSYYDFAFVVFEI